MPTILRWKPTYEHQHQISPPKSALSADEMAGIIRKIQPFIALEEYAHAPAANWSKDRPRRDLFFPSGFHHAVCWMPVLKKGWRRLKFDELLAWYGIKPFDRPYCKGA